LADLRRPVLGYTVDTDQRLDMGRAAITWVVVRPADLRERPTTVRRPDHPVAAALAAVMLDRSDDCMTKFMRTWLLSMRVMPLAGVRPAVDPLVVLPVAMVALVPITVLLPVVVRRVVLLAVIRPSCAGVRRVEVARVAVARVVTAMAAPTAADTHR